MPEIKRVWLVVTPGNQKDLDWLWTDPAMKNATDADRLEQFCGALAEGGYDMDKFMRVVFGTPAAAWWKEKSKVYDDEASARKDAEKRLAKAKKAYEGRKTASRVVDRYHAAERSHEGR
jgi:hypothetical protein